MQFVEVCDFFGAPDYKYGNLIRGFGAKMVAFTDEYPKKMFDLICFSNFDEFKKTQLGTEKFPYDLDKILRLFIQKIRFGGYLFLDTQDKDFKHHFAEISQMYIKPIIWNNKNEIIFYRKVVDEEWGVPRFYYYNRQNVGEIQKEILREVIVSFADEPKKGIVMGGPSNELKQNKKELEGKIDTVNIDGESFPYGNIRADRPLPIEDNTYNIIQSCHSFEHMENPLETLQEWIRILKPGGLVLLIVPDNDFCQHNMDENIKLGDRCFTALSAEEWKEQVFDKLQGVEILQFNRKRNNFDFEAILRKI